MSRFSYLTNFALFGVKLNSTIWDSFYDAEHSLEVKIKRIGLKTKTKGLIGHDHILDLRDRDEESLTASS